MRANEFLAILDVVVSESTAGMNAVSIGYRIASAHKEGHATREKFQDPSCTFHATLPRMATGPPPPRFQ
eukprot:544895-Rhodomonas_salina.1